MHQWRKYYNDKLCLVRPTSARTGPNGIVEPIHEKAMPVLIRSKDEAEQ